MTLHEVWAEFTAELASLFARFHSHPVVQAAATAQTPVPPLAPPAPAAPATPPPAPTAASTAAYEGGGTQVSAQTGAEPDHYGSVLEHNGMDYRFYAPGKSYTMPVTPGGYTLSLADGGGAARVDVAYSDGTAISPPEGWQGWISWQFTADRADTVSIKVVTDTQGSIERQQW